MESPIKWYEKQNKFVKASLIFITTLVIALLIFVMAYKQMGRVATTSMQPYVETDEIVNKYMYSLQKPDCMGVKYFNTFKEHQKILDKRKSHHLHISIIFFKNYYSVLLMLMILSCTGGITLFVLSNMGWANTGIELQSFFLSLVFCVAFYGLFPTVFKQEENYNKNLSQYMEYTKTELNIVRRLSFLSIECENIKSDSSLLLYNNKVDSIINLNTKELNTLTNHILNFDPSKIKTMGELSSLIYEMKNKKDSL